jgi:hypothetical protein
VVQSLPRSGVLRRFPPKYAKAAKRLTRSTTKSIHYGNQRHSIGLSGNDKDLPQNKTEASKFQIAQVEDCGLSSRDEDDGNIMVDPLNLSGKWWVYETR